MIRGSLPSILAAKIREEPLKSSIEWAKLHFWFVDERYVAPDDKDSNYLEVKKQLFDHVDVPRENIHLPNTQLPLDECAADYEAKLREFFPEPHVPKIDIILLGMGPDGHTASLFPHHALLKETTKLIAPIADSPKPPPQRITFTFPLINNGHIVAFVVHLHEIGIICVYGDALGCW